MWHEKTWSKSVGRMASILEMLGLNEAPKKSSEKPNNKVIDLQPASPAAANKAQAEEEKAKGKLTSSQTRSPWPSSTTPAPSTWTGRTTCTIPIDHTPISKLTMLSTL